MTRRAARASGLALAAILAAFPGAASAMGQALRQASDDLGEAADILSETDTAAARAAALDALEDARAALRQALRRNLARHETLAARLAARRQALLRLRIARSAADRAPAQAWAVRAEGPRQAARDLLRAEARRPAAVAALDRAALDLAQLETEADALEAARTSLLDLAEAAYGGAKPDPAAAAVLLARLAPDPSPATPPRRRPPAPGAMPPPVEGRVLFPFRAPDRLGRPTPGITLETAPGAAIRAPVPASVLIAEPLPHRGHAAVLELEPGRFLILADLSVLSVRAGDTLPAGAVVGHVGVRPARSPDFTVELPAAKGSPSSPTLYMEARQDGAAVDPALWFNAYEEATSP